MFAFLWFLMQNCLTWMKSFLMDDRGLSIWHNQGISSNGLVFLEYSSFRIWSFTIQVRIQ